MSAKIDYRQCPFCEAKKLISDRGLLLHVKRAHADRFDGWVGGSDEVDGGGVGTGRERASAGGERMAPSAASISGAGADCASAAGAGNGDSGSSRGAAVGDRQLSADDHALLVAVAVMEDEILSEFLGIGSG